MTMDLKTALACVEEWRRARVAVDATVGSATYAFVDGVPVSVTDALVLVLAKARENFAAETVAKVNALSSEVLRDQPHTFRPHLVVLVPTCRVCGRDEFHPLHREPGGTP